MKNFFGKCVAAYLMTYLAFGTVSVYAQDDDMWGDFDASEPIPDYEPEPQPSQPSQPFGSAEPEQYDFGGTGAEPTFDEYNVPTESGQQFGLEPEPEEPHVGYGSFDIDESYSTEARVDQSAINFIRVIRQPRKAPSDFQNAVIEGLQVSTDKGKDLEEMIVTCYFIFRDKPSSYFYDIDRKNKKLIFEFIDTRTGSSPIAALEQSPLKEIVIEETQVDANKDIKGLNPEWHDMIRISFHLENIPVISVSDESNIISFKYKWTTNPEKYKEYTEVDRFPLVFWISGGVLGAIGIGTLTYFLLPKKEIVVDNSLTDRDLPHRPTYPGGRPAQEGRAKARAKR